MSQGTIRLDKWLWHARFFKTRTLAIKEVQAGHIRLNAERITKPAQAIAPGDTLTFAQGDRIRVVRLIAIGTRRGPAPEAQALYEDLSPPADKTEAPANPAYDLGGRPTKKHRRTLDLSRRPPLE
ncbi:MAG: RNA-binding S4 domain-containing protein [Paracoccaceae bacterium]|nr:RNA-binding S4 domain-containing protein [Paracoccaceae bacterium]